jgi:hypothetical protein
VVVVILYYEIYMRVEFFVICVCVYMMYYLCPIRVPVCNSHQLQEADIRITGSLTASSPGSTHKS